MCTSKNRCSSFVGTKHMLKTDSGTYKQKCAIEKDLCLDILRQITNA